MIAVLLLFPLAGAAIVLAARSRIADIAAVTAYAAVHLAISIMLCMRPGQFTRYFSTDGLNVFFLLILSMLFFGTALYNISYMRHDRSDPKSRSLYSASLLIFAATMTGVILSTHLVLLWVFVEATTLSSSYLIYFSRSEASLEATWKYLFICSIGISIAFVGIIFLSTGLNTPGSLFFSDLYAQAAYMDPFWLKLAFPFILVGLGTKAGLAPVHAWLPDAHSEAPSPVSALLSGALLNAAFLGIIRVGKIMTLAGMGSYAGGLLRLMGFISIFAASVYIIRIKNYKRMLAYSSIENMGVIAIGLGLGGAGAYAAMLHLAAHSLTKGSFFLTAGNILHRFRSRNISDVSGLLRKDNISGWLWLLCFAAISGLPPFPMFISEFIVVRAFVAEGSPFYAALFLLLLTVVIAGMGRSVFRMSFGAGDDGIAAGRPDVLTYLPQIIFMAMLLYMGISMPRFVSGMIRAAAAML